MSTTNESQQAAYALYDSTTSRWGRITMILGLLLSWVGPVYLVFFSDLKVDPSDAWVGFVAVAASFFTLWFIEPITYFPVLGPAAMYQVFMIGNIANKLLPAAIAAQSTIDAKPGTKRAELAAVVAIGGAVVVHLLSLLVLVGVLGTWLLSVIPDSITTIAQLYILPAILGAVVVQLGVYVKQPRITAIALAVAILAQLVLVPLVPALEDAAIALVVLATMVLAWLLRDRSARAADLGQGNAEADDS